MDSNLIKLEKKINIKFKNFELLIKSLTHKSYDSIHNNEKLEFLGDRVIALILSKKLYELYPKEGEGVLDKRLSRLVNRKTCAEIAWQNGFGNFILTGKQNLNITIKDEKILSDACEAIVGAIFLDKGYEYVGKFVLRLWKKRIDKSNVTILDSKTMLQEYSLKLYKKLPVYHLHQVKGPRHNPTFKIAVYIGNTKKFIGYGNSKKEAEQNAAENLLKTIKTN